MPPNEEKTAWEHENLSKTLSVFNRCYVAEIDVMFADQKCIVSSEVSLIFPPLIINFVLTHLVSQSWWRGWWWWKRWGWRKVWFVEEESEE